MGGRSVPQSGRVLLVETATYWIPPDYRLGGLDLWPAGYIPSGRFRTGNEQIGLPDPLEFDLIVSDIANFIENEGLDRNKNEGTGFRPVQFQNLALAALTQMESTQKDRSRFEQCIRAGRLMIFIAGAPFKHLDAFFPSLRDLRDMELNQRVGPAPCFWEESEGPLADLIHTFRDDFEWRIAFEDPATRPKRPPLPLMPSYYHSPRTPPRPTSKKDHERMHILAHNRAGQVVAARVELGEGEVIMLPNIGAASRRADLVQYIVRTFIPAYRPSVVPGHWINQYWPAVIGAEQARIARLEEELHRRLEAEKGQLEAQMARVLPFRPLIHTKGQELKDLVMRSFRDVLGFEVTDMDIVRAESKVFDLRATGYGQRFAVEVRGKERGALAGGDIDQLLKNVKKYGEAGLHPVLVLNPAYSFPGDADQRNFSPDQIKYALDTGVTVVSTPVLYDALAMILNGSLRADRFSRMMTKAGAMRLP